MSGVEIPVCLSLLLDSPSPQLFYHSFSDQEILLWLLVGRILLNFSSVTQLLHWYPTALCCFSLLQIVEKQTNYTLEV